MKMRKIKARLNARKRSVFTKEPKTIGTTIRIDMPQQKNPPFRIMSM